MKEKKKKKKKGGATAEKKEEAQPTKKKKKNKPKPAPVPEPEPSEEEEEEDPNVIPAGFELASAKRDNKRKARAERVAERKQAEASKDQSDPNRVDDYVEISSEDMGLVIGKKGCNLADLEEATGCTFQTPDKTFKGAKARPQKVRINGLPEEVEKAKQAIRELADQGFSALLDGLSQTVRNEVTVHPDLHNRIYGKDGNIIRAISSGANVRVDMPDKGTGGVIRLKGSDAGVEAAREAILQLVATGISDLTHPGQFVDEFSFPGNKLFHLFGLKGKVIRDLQDETDTRINVPKKEERTGPSVIISIAGKPEGVRVVRQRLEEILLINDDPEELPPTAEWGGAGADGVTPDLSQFASSLWD
mmetsp:Transcript_9530/g.10768  ORF Transcript_9530/g.10768 Transcript_9530/m.10768 type:complete len:361 (+) Transcript_9530:221-1303(+)